MGLAAGLIASPASAASPERAPGGSALDGLSGQEIAERAQGQLQSMSSLHLKLRSSGFSLSLSLDERGNCAGTASMDSQGKLKMVKRGDTVWLKPNAAFWKSQVGGARGQAVDDVVDGRYIKGKSSDTLMEGMSSTCDLKAFRASTGVTGGDPTNWKRAATGGGGGEGGGGGGGGDERADTKGTTEYKGRPAVRITSTQGEATLTMLVSAKGKPYPLALSSATSEGKDVLGLSGFDKPVPKKTPSADDTISVKELTRKLESEQGGQEGGQPDRQDV
ncbi:hypothetical protein [Streptomyces daliensis]